MKLLMSSFCFKAIPPTVDTDGGMAKPVIHPIYPASNLTSPRIGKLQNWFCNQMYALEYLLFCFDKDNQIEMTYNLENIQFHHILIQKIYIYLSELVIYIFNNFSLLFPQQSKLF